MPDCNSEKNDCNKNMFTIEKKAMKQEQEKMDI
jgi:hypothetical protein